MAQTKYTGSNALTYIFTVVKQYVTGLLANKVDKDGSKVLSTNDYTTADKEKLAGIATGAQVNVLEKVSVNGAVQQVTEKGVNISVPTAVSQLTNDSGYQKASDVATAIAGKADTTTLEAHTGNNDIHVTANDKSKWNAKQDALTAGSNITIQGNVISASGEILNSVAWDNITGDISNNTALQGALDDKANASDLTGHTSNTDVHVTAQKKAEWDAKLDADDIANLATKDEVGAKADATTLTAHTGNSDVHVTTSDKSNWNGKTTMSEVEAKGYQTSSQVESAITSKGYQTASQVETAITSKGYQTAEQVQTAISEASSLAGRKFNKVEVLPETGDEKYIYLVPAEDPDEENYYDEFYWDAENNRFEFAGSTKMDLSGYVLATDLIELTNEEIQGLWDGAGL